jgi:hypothetical protein
MRRLLPVLLLCLPLLLRPDPARAFCGFYVAKADTRLFNRASQVALVRDGERTAMTMANDFRGELKEFAIVIPVPVVPRRDQIEIGDKAVLDHLDAYSAPRLVEYFDEDPCAPRVVSEMMPMAAQAPAPSAGRAERAKALGVTIEARYSVGEYDILILSAQQSGGLETWLKENGYRIPQGASPVLGSYIRQSMKFFVAKVNLKEQAKTGFTYLRPLRVSYESPRFMLPIRLGTVNAEGPQDLVILSVSRKGRVETTNYMTVKLPTGQELPPYVKGEFGEFYKAMFATQVKKEDMRAVFLEYAWDMGWCDPCAADPLSAEELRKLGVPWLEGGEQVQRPAGAPSMVRPPPPIRVPPGQAVNAYVTRLHVRYDAAHFPEDLMFQETANRESFQGRYVIRHPWTGQAACPAVDEYRRQLAQRQEKEAQTLAWLTGWDVGQIRSKARGSAQKISEEPRSLWQQLSQPATRR